MSVAPVAPVVAPVAAPVAAPLSPAEFEEFCEWLEGNIRSLRDSAYFLFSDKNVRVAVALCICANLTLKQLQDDTENPSRLAKVEGNAAMHMLWKSESRVFACLANADCLDEDLRAEYRETSEVLNARALGLLTENVSEFLQATL